MQAIDIGRRRVQLTLLAVVALAAILLSIVAMHASMVDSDGAAGHVPSGQSMAAPMAGASQVDDSMSSDHAIGDMDPVDCLLLGMVCFLTAVALLLLAVMVGRLRSLLRPRAAAQSLGSALRRLRPPEPPSLLVLSISRT